ncbi:HAMP domain-containing histidine kinase [bacterium]|nr:HAMP domain-containing histidine kinase [bacterium]
MERLRTLVVDDELGMREGIRRALDRFEFRIPDVDETYGFEVDTAENGAEAARKIRSAAPDVLLLDYKLPDTTGLEILERFRPELSESVTLMITAYASLETAVSAIKGGAFDFLAKPFTPDELRKTLTKAAQNLLLARQVKKLAREQRKVRFQFISVLGHELKAPLNAVEGYLHMIRDRTLGDSLSDYDEPLNRSLLRLTGMRKIIHDLLDLTRIESGAKRREPAEQDLASVLKTAVETVLPQAGEKGVSITVDAPPEFRFRCDAGEIEMILNNLITNAVKYNRDGGRVDIRLEDENGTARLTVRDTGIGMTPEETAMLFREFVRIKNEKTRSILGSGLGLAIVKKLALMYGGDVSVESEPDRGSTFTVMLRPIPAE